MGSDGKRYPTWHPPEGEEQGRPCTFGHEHGRDPRGSALLADVEAQYGGLLFGYANEQLDEYNRAERISERMRHEDHVGHKIEWENDVQVFESVTNGGANQRALAVRCDFLMKVHQGTHSPDAFTNNLHELLYAAQCRDRGDGSIGTKLIAYSMVQFGDPGGFSEGGVAGGFGYVKVGLPSPAKSPAGGGLRSIPTIGRVQSAVLVPPGERSDYSRGLYEDWISANYLRRPGGREPLAYFDPHFAVFLPSRFHWPARKAESVEAARTAADQAAQIGRTIDVCYASAGARKAGGGECDRVAGSVPPVAWDDPRSPFDGVKREFYFNQTTIVNAGNPTTLVHGPLRRPRRRSAVSRRDQAVRRRRGQPQAQRRRRDQRRRTRLPVRVAGLRQGPLVWREGRACTELGAGDWGLGTRACNVKLRIACPFGDALARQLNTALCRGTQHAPVPSP